MSVYSAAGNVTTPAQTISRASWVPILRGVVSVIFGLLAIFFPISAVATFVIIFAVYTFMDGILALIAAVRMAGSHRPFVWQLIEGVLGFVIGIYAFVNPVGFGAAIAQFVGAWAIITGIFALVTAFHIRQHVPGEWAQAAGGVFSILLGIILFATPGAGLIAWAWMIGAYAIIFGVISILLGMRLRKAAASV